MATLYPPPTPARVGRMVGRRALHARTRTRGAWRAPPSQRDSIGRRAFLNPRPGRAGVAAYDERARAPRRARPGPPPPRARPGCRARTCPSPPAAARRAAATCREETLAPVHARQSWSWQDHVLRSRSAGRRASSKRSGTSSAPSPPSFGHAGMGGALGWCDPVNELAFGYVMNQMDWRVRSPRAVALCRALYESEALLDPRGLASDPRSQMSTPESVPSHRARHDAPRPARRRRASTREDAHPADVVDGEHRVGARDDDGAELGDLQLGVAPEEERAGGHQGDS